MTPPQESIDTAAPTPPRIIGSEATRGWIYRIALAVMLLAVVLKWIPTGLEDAILEVVRAVLGISSAGLAAANTSIKKGQG